MSALVFAVPSKGRLMEQTAEFLAGAGLKLRKTGHDRGYRGEMECIVAKIFGSEAQKEAAVELFMKTHGGRSFLHGHAAPAANRLQRPERP